MFHGAASGAASGSNLSGVGVRSSWRIARATSDKSSVGFENLLRNTPVAYASVRRMKSSWAGSGVTP